jgi:hypothetical protein
LILACPSVPLFRVSAYIYFFNYVFLQEGNENYIKQCFLIICMYSYVFAKLYYYTYFRIPPSGDEINLIRKQHTISLGEGNKAN